MKKFGIKTESAIQAFAKEYAAKLRGGEVVLLQGELGAGKTTFVRAVARALGIKEKIKSPTFTLMNTYKVKGQRSNVRCQVLVHADVYRIKDPSEIVEIGLMEWIGKKDAVVFVEWGEKIKPLLKKGSYLMMKFEHCEKEEERVIRY